MVLAKQAATLRFSIDHMFRLWKDSLGWTKPRVRYPEQADRWTWIVLAAYTQLRLARGLVADQKLPWEKPLNPNYSRGNESWCFNPSTEKGMTGRAP